MGIAHPDGSGAVVYPDGSLGGFDPGTPSSDAAVGSWALDVGVVADWIAAHAAASSAALAKVAMLASDLLRAFDLDRVGALGHSLGGAWCAPRCRPRACAAAANVDGSFRGPILVRDPDAPLQVMLFDGHLALDPSPMSFRESASR